MYHVVSICIILRRGPDIKHTAALRYIHNLFTLNALLSIPCQYVAHGEIILDVFNDTMQRKRVVSPVLTRAM